MTGNRVMARILVFTSVPHLCPILNSRSTGGNVINEMWTVPGSVCKAQIDMFTQLNVSILDDCGRRFAHCDRLRQSPQWFCNSSTRSGLTSRSVPSNSAPRAITQIKSTFSPKPAPSCRFVASPKVMDTKGDRIWVYRIKITPSFRLGRKARANRTNGNIAGSFDRRSARSHCPLARGPLNLLNSLLALYHHLARASYPALLPPPLNHVQNLKLHGFSPPSTSQLLQEETIRDSRCARNRIVRQGHGASRYVFGLSMHENECHAILLLDCDRPQSGMYPPLWSTPCLAVKRLI